MICFDAVHMFNVANCVVAVGLTAVIGLTLAAIVCKKVDKNGEPHPVGVLLAAAAMLMFVATAMFSFYSQESIRNYNESVLQYRSSR